MKDKLFENFPPVTTGEWMDKITADLKGEDFAAKMVWRTNEGFELLPFYRSADINDLPFTGSLPGRAPFVRGGGGEGNRWLVRQNIEVDDFADASRKANDSVMRGADSLGFMIKDPDKVTIENIGRLLDGINPEETELNFRPEGKAREVLDIIIKYYRGSGFDLTKVRGSVEADPLGRLMLNGKLCIPFSEGMDYLALLVKESAPLPQFRIICADASLFANAGGDVVSELAFGLSMGNEYLASLSERDLDHSFISSRIRFRFGTGSNYFFEIAKLRAARLLWSVITDKYGISGSEARKLNIHSVTNTWNKTKYDPYANLLRTQTEAMSAALGGADSITVEPFDAVTGRTSEFSERIARNQQLLLREEAYFDKVADPAGGSYYLERLTSLLAEKAWRLFVDTEEAGGFNAALGKGIIQERISGVNAKRLKDVSARKEVLVGTNQYPDYTELLVSSTGGVTSGNDKNESYEVIPIVLRRGAEEIEMLREMADNEPVRPVAFMLTIGNQSMRRARAQFSCNFFACGGYRVIDNNGFDTVEEGINAAIGSSADLIVLCSSDEEYAIHAPVAAGLVSGRAVLVVAGNPPCMAELKSKGIEHFISIRSGLAETIALFHGLTGIGSRKMKVSK